MTKGITTPRAARLTVACSTIALAGWLSACSSGASAPPPMYSLGGSVSGLSTSGLVLVNSGKALAVGSGATSFSYGSILTAGTSYAVTVQTQPSGETCSVSAGSGVATSANVANVVVRCAPTAFTLGGAVSGLTAGGLVLATADQTLTVAAGATNFAFPAKIATGSAYAVTVKTQPAGLACAVSSSSGTMPASNVSTVAVTCTDQPFNLGGSISGLTTAGLVLANGTDTLTVNANAMSFTMPVKVAYGSHYALNVQSQPTGLTCSVNNGTGTMPAQAITSVAVVCADQSYMLSGSISGLTASGLVLANGNDTDSVSAGATSFTMPSLVAYGSPYAVTVQTQPTGLTCTVSNATGTMGAGSVNNVAVTCAVTTYTVGGSISGLAASGLVLANGTDTLSVAANAAVFTMPTGVTSGSTYDVTVQTQPSSQTCTVSNGSGTVATSDITNVSVSCVTIVSFTTAGTYSWTVPDGVTSVQMVATGGGGGGSFNYAGGNGGVVTATLAVTPGDTFALVVGGGGAYNGTGGGGGSTNVNAGTSDQIVAGGGGGAGGGAAGNATGGDGGGNGTSTGSNGNAGNSSAGFGGNAGIGGAGGSVTGPFGGTSGSPGGNGNGGAGGPGGDCGMGGAGGSGSGTGTGGAGGTACAGGGGGGGYGGGGGAGSGPSGDGGGGGGGSTGPAGAVFSVATNGGAVDTNGSDGSVVITLNP
jgi:hypothetical protein